MQNTNKIYMILTNGFDPDVRVYKEAKYLVNKGFEVTILCWDRICEFKDRTEETINGIEIKRFHILSQPGTGLKQILPYLKFMKKVRKYLKNKEYTYLHCHDFDGILIGLVAKRDKEKNIIFDMHEIYNDYSFGKSIFFQKFFNYAIKKSDYIIYVNQDQIKEIKQTEKLIYLPNYPEKKIYFPIEKTVEEHTRVNYIGSVRDYNSLKSLIEAQTKDIIVGIYGMGTCYQRLKEEYKDKPVNIYGKYNGITQIGELYRNTDILYCVYDPTIENWRVAYPVKLYEAIITRTPVIVSSNTIAEKFVKENGIGESIEYGNKDSIIEAINKIANNYSKYKENIEEIANNYNWENVANNLNKIYCM